MAIQLERYEWGKGVRVKRPVNEAVVQEMVDFILGNSMLWERDPELFERRRRRWAQQIDVMPVVATSAPIDLQPEPSPPPAPVLVAVGVDEPEPPLVRLRSTPGEAKIRALHEEGRSLSEIKKLTGMPGTTIRGVLGRA